MRISPFLRNQYKPVPFKSQQIFHLTFRTCLHLIQQSLKQVVGTTDPCSRFSDALANQCGELYLQSGEAMRLPPFSIVDTVLCKTLPDNDAVPFDRPR